MRTYLSLFLGCCLAIIAMSSCSKSSGDNNNNPHPVYPPTSISAMAIHFNNINTSIVPANDPVYSVYVELYADNVLLAKSSDCYVSTFPDYVTFQGDRTFSYSIKEYDLKYYGHAPSGQTYTLGTVHLALKDYSSDTYPEPTAMFFNTNSFAGTLDFLYTQ